MQSLLFILLLELVLLLLLIYVVSIGKRVKTRQFNVSIENYFIRENVRLKLNMIYTEEMLERDRKILNTTEII